MRQRTFVIGVAFVVLVSVGALFKNLHLPGAGVMLVFAALFNLAFSIMFLKDKISIERNREARISVIVLSIAMLMIILAALATYMHWPLASPLSYFALVIFSVYLVFFTRYTEGRKLKSQKNRQLATILFTDIVGFTKMMGENEDKTLQALDRSRSIHKKLVRKYRGDWVKEMGDGVIAIFYTVSEAIECAIEIQKEVQNQENFTLSMGVHVSEVLFTEQDIFGDGVNVASRISSLAQSNEIWFSSTVYENVRNREDLTIEDMGLRKLKNVAYDVNVYKLTV